MKTSSTHRSAFVQATHRFDILGYSALKSLGARTTVRSGGFDAAGFPWALVCCFDKRTGRRGIFLASISLELSKNETGNEVVAMAGLRIDEGAGTGQFPAAVWRSDKANTFGAWSGRAVAWELSVPAAFRDHEARYVDADADRLTIHCTVDVLQQEDAAGATRDCFVSVPPPPSISRDLHKLFKGGRCPPDVTFVVEDTEIPAHKLVLAMRSSVFRAQFFRGDLNLKERPLKIKIKIDDMSASTFRAMLYFIYTDEQPMPKRRACRVAMAQDLLVAADLYDLERLMLMCEKILSENMGVDNVMTTLMQIHGRDSCRQLEACCVEFLASNPDVFGAVEATEEYKELEKDCGAFMNELTKKVAKRAVARHSPSSSSSGSSLVQVQPHRSVSRYNPNALVRGRHDLVIENLSVVRQMSHAGVNGYIRSGTFHVGAYEWAIDVYPWAKGEDGKEEHVGIYLTLVNAPTGDGINVKASSCFRINDPSPTFSHGVGDMSPYTKIGQSFGNMHFFTLESATAPDGSLTIHGEVQVTSESRSSTGGAYVGAAIVVPPTGLSWHLEQLLASQQGSDVKFLVEQSEIHAHRLVIAARSPVLHKLVELADNMDHVMISGMDAMAFKAVLHFIYTDELPRLDDLVLSRDFITVTGDMLAASCWFRLERLKWLCVNLLAEKVTTVSNALATLKVARRHNCPELEDYCRRYMSLPHVANKVREACISLFLESQIV